MKFLYLKVLLLICFTMLSQSKKGNLLLLQIDKVRDLSIDKFETDYHVIELDSAYFPLGDLNSTYSKKVYFYEFTDRQLFSCTNKDSIALKTVWQSDTWDHDKIGMDNAKLIGSNLDGMKYLMDFKIKSNAMYNQKIKISYLLISCNYCVSNIAKWDGEFIGYQGEIVLIIDDLSVNKDYKLTSENIYEVVKQINYNKFIY